MEKVIEADDKGFPTIRYNPDELADAVSNLERLPKLIKLLSQDVKELAKSRRLLRSIDHASWTERVNALHAALSQALEAHHEGCEDEDEVAGAMQ